jgi:hypothetical protein
MGKSQQCPVRILQILADTGLSFRGALFSKRKACARESTPGIGRGPAGAGQAGYCGGPVLPFSA